MPLCHCERSEAIQKNARAVRANMLPMVTLGELKARLPKPGPMIAERYRLVEKIGRGGFGLVWSAEDLRSTPTQSSVPAHSAATVLS